MAEPQIPANVQMTHYQAACLLEKLNYKDGIYEALAKHIFVSGNRYYPRVEGATQLKLLSRDEFLAEGKRLGATEDDELPKLGRAFDAAWKEGARGRNPEMGSHRGDGWGGRG